jgi:surface antigen
MTTILSTANRFASIAARIAVVPAIMATAIGLSAGAAHAATPTYLTLGSPTLNERSAPSTGASVIGSLPYHTTITINCQTTGSDVNGSSIWDQLSNQAYVADYYVNTPDVGTFSPGLARCSSVAPPPVGRNRGVTTNHNQGASGQCTWWADEEFHAFSGLWPDFTGNDNNNAMYWAANARAKGWTVVATPEVDSVAVFEPGMNGAGQYGHVAWVTRVSDGQITISEMDAYFNGGGPGKVDVRTIVPASGVQYILAP